MKCGSLAGRMPVLATAWRRWRTVGSWLAGRRVHHQEVSQAAAARLRGSRLRLQEQRGEVETTREQGAAALRVPALFVPAWGRSLGCRLPCSGRRLPGPLFWRVRLSFAWPSSLWLGRWKRSWWWWRSPPHPCIPSPTFRCGKTGSCPPRGRCQQNSSSHTWTTKQSSRFLPPWEK